MASVWLADINGIEWLEGHSALGSWLEGSASLVALVFATIAARHAAGLLRREAKRDETRDRILRRAQASLVTAWWDSGRKGLQVRNASDSVVYTASATMFDNQNHEVLRTAAQLGTIAPSNQAHFFKHTDLGWADTQLADPRIEMVFTDSQGILWNRRGTGAIEHVQRPFTLWADGNRLTVLAHLVAEYLRDKDDVQLDFRPARMESFYERLMSSRKNGEQVADLFATTHDRIPALVEAGLIAQMPFSPTQAKNLFHEKAANGVIYNHRGKSAVYGLPYGIDTVGLFRRGGDDPKDLKDLIDRGNELCQQKAWPWRHAPRMSLALPVGATGEAWMAYPLLAGANRSLWATVEGANQRNGAPAIELDDESVVNGLATLSDIFRMSNLDPHATRTSARSAFLRGDAAFLISSATVLNRLSEARNGPILLSPVPSEESGKPARSLVLVQVLVAPVRGAHHALALDLLNRLASARGPLGGLGPTLAPMPALKEAQNRRLEQENRAQEQQMRKRRKEGFRPTPPYTKKLLELCDDADLFPPTPSAPHLWDTLNYAETLIVRENEEPKAALERARQKYLLQHVTSRRPLLGRRK